MDSEWIDEYSGNPNVQRVRRDVSDADASVSGLAFAVSEKRYTAISVFADVHSVAEVP